MEYVVLSLLRNYIVPIFCTNCICVPGRISKQPSLASPHCEGRLLGAVQADRKKEVAGKKQIWLTTYMNPVVIILLLFS